MGAEYKAERHRDPLEHNGFVPRLSLREKKSKRRPVIEHLKMIFGFLRIESLFNEHYLSHASVSRIVFSGLLLMTSRLLKIPVATVSKTLKQNAQMRTPGCKCQADLIMYFMTTQEKPCAKRIPTKPAMTPKVAYSKPRMEATVFLLRTENFQHCGFTQTPKFCGSNRSGENKQSSRNCEARHKIHQCG